jgi:acylphosphatase
MSSRSAGPRVAAEPATGRARLEATVRGRVQGVGFRFHVLQRATELGLVGFVANEADGGVRCVAEGPRDALDRLLDDLRIGPRGAHVVDVRSTWSAPSGSYSTFGVRSGSHPGD